MDRKAESICEALMCFSGSDSPAVWCGGREVRYRELCRKGRSVAQQLIRLGVVKGDRVVLSVGRSADAIIAMLGILLSGAVLVPLSGDLPKKLRDYILRDCSPKLVVDEALLGDLLPRAAQEDGENAALPTLYGEDLFAILYTSGSTGNPKGAALRHGTIIHFCRPEKENLLPGLIAERSRRCLVDFSFSFVSFYIFSSAVLIGGKCLIVATDEQRLTPKALAVCMSAGRADTLFHTPSLLIHALTDPLFRDSLKEIRLLGLIGEKLTEQRMDSICPHLPEDMLLCITYASTEMALVTCTVLRSGRGHHLERNAFPETEEAFLKGRVDLLEHPCRDVLCLVLDEDGSPVSVGECGELCIGALPARLGMYWNDDALNAERYEDHPQYGRIFHTRDLVRREKGGSLRFMRRMDGMIKLHGQRVEPGMIEQAMLLVPGIRQALVVLHERKDTQVLAAYYTTQPEKEPPEERVIRKELSLQLPFRMIPAFMKRLERIPLLTSGKPDRRRLSSLPLTGNLSSFAAPDSSNDSKDSPESLLCRLYQEILALEEEVGPTDSFFVLGGDSLSGMLLQAALKERGWHMELKWLYMAPSPAALARVMKEAAEEHKALDEEEALPALPPITASQQRFAAQAGIRGKIECVLPVTDQVAGCLKAHDAWMIPLFMVLSPADGKELAERFRQLQGTCTALRSVFLMPENERPVQAVLKNPPPVSCFFADRTFESEEGVLLSERQKRYLGRVAVFDTARAPDPFSEIPIRAGFVQISPEKAVFYLYFSHLLLDQMGIDALLKRLLGGRTSCSDLSRVVRHARLMLSAREEDVMDWKSLGFLKKGQKERKLTLFPTPAKSPAGNRRVLRYLFLEDETIARAAAVYCAEKAVGFSALLHCLFGRALCSALNLQECAFWTVTAGRQGDELELAGLFSFWVPFVCSRRDTPADCRRRLLRLRERAQIWAMAKEHDLPAPRKQEVCLNVMMTGKVGENETRQELSLFEAMDVVSAGRMMHGGIQMVGAGTPDVLMFYNAGGKRLLSCSYPAEGYDTETMEKLKECLVSEARLLLNL